MDCFLCGWAGLREKSPLKVIDILVLPLIWNPQHKVLSGTDDQQFSFCLEHILRRKNIHSFPVLLKLFICEAI